MQTDQDQHDYFKQFMDPCFDEEFRAREAFKQRMEARINRIRKRLANKQQSLRRWF
jgi:hypothetical protein